MSITRAKLIEAIKNNAKYDCVTRSGRESIAEIVAETLELCGLVQWADEMPVLTMNDILRDGLQRKLDQEKAIGATTYAELRQAQEEIERLKAELNVRKGDPTTRLHNLCRGLEEDSRGSAYTQEEWDAVDQETVRLQNEVASLKERLVQWNKWADATGLNLAEAVEKIRLLP